jgi:cell division protein FtsW
METTEHKKWTLKPGGDLTLWVIAGILGVVSLLVVYSSTGAFAYGPGHIGGSHLSVLVRQMVIVAMGLVVIYLVHKVNYQFYGRIVWVAYVTALVFTILVYFIGEVNPEAPDAPRWIRIPIVNFTFQPSDFLKVATVMVVARESARRLKTISGESVFPPLGGIFAGRRTNPNTRTAVRRAARRRASKILRETTLPLFAPIVVACAAILPTNLSTTLILFGTCLVMLFIARMRTSDLLRFIALIAIAGAVVILPLALSGTLKRADTWTGRFERFFAGEKSYQVEQAEIAIASGGLTGRGAGESIQRANLPLAESDYAYAFIIEEYGSLIGGLVVWLL